MRYFLMRFDRETLTPSLTAYDDRQEALAALREAERDGEPHIEIVLFMAESEESLRVTHSSYFTHHQRPRAGETTDFPSKLNEITETWRSRRAQPAAVAAGR